MFKYLETALTNKNCIEEEIKSRLNWEEACYYPVQSILSSRLISKNIQMKICERTIIRVVLYGCETWSVTLREEYKLRMFDKRVLKRMFESKREEVEGSCRRLHNEEIQNL
jgi:hypothetical protein